MAKKKKAVSKTPAKPQHDFHHYENRTKSKRFAMRVSPNFAYVVAALIEKKKKEAQYSYWGTNTSTNIIEDALKEYAVKNKVMKTDDSL